MIATIRISKNDYDSTVQFGSITMLCWVVDYSMLATVRPRNCVGIRGESNRIESYHTTYPAPVLLHCSAVVGIHIRIYSSNRIETTMTTAQNQDVSVGQQHPKRRP